MTQRIDGLRQTLKEKNIDAFLVSNFYNILYLSGFKTLVDNEREAWFLVTQTNEYLFTDSRYSSGDRKINLITPNKRLTQHLEEIIVSEKIKSLGFEADDLKVLEHESLRESLKGLEFIPTNSLILKQREVKDPGEIEKVRQACRIADDCLDQGVREIKLGKTEREIAFKIEFILKESGHDLAFYPIVAVDENSAIPHYDTRGAGDKKIKEGSVVLIDFGAKYQDYLSDMTRVVFVGTPTQEVVNTYNCLAQAQLKTLEFLSKNINKKITLDKVDEFCRRELINLGLHDYSHSTGHGVGLEIHEYPKLSPVSKDVLVAGQIITVEPGIYLEGKRGMRIEDTVLIKKDGVECLSLFDKKLLVV